jgi:Siphovirus Gp157
MTAQTTNGALAAEVGAYNVWRERLIAEFPDLDEETLADTLQGLTSLPEMLAAIIRSSLEDEALAVGLSHRIGDMQARFERLELRRERKRQVVRVAMIAAQIPKLVEPEFAVGLRRGAPTLNVTDETVIPAAYWRAQPPKLDRDRLLRSLKSGVAVDGAGLRDPEVHLSVRTR